MGTSTAIWLESKLWTAADVLQNKSANLIPANLLFNVSGWRHVPMRPRAMEIRHGAGRRRDR